MSLSDDAVTGISHNSPSLDELRAQYAAGKAPSTHEPIFSAQSLAYPDVIRLYIDRQIKAIEAQEKNVAMMLFGMHL